MLVVTVTVADRFIQARYTRDECGGEDAPEKRLERDCRRIE